MVFGYLHFFYFIFRRALSTSFAPRFYCTCVSDKCHDFSCVSFNVINWMCLSLYSHPKPKKSWTHFYRAFQHQCISITFDTLSYSIAQFTWNCQIGIKKKLLTAIIIIKKWEARAFFFSFIHFSKAKKKTFFFVIAGIHLCHIATDLTSSRSLIASISYFVVRRRCCCCYSIIYQSVGFSDVEIIADTLFCAVCCDKSGKRKKLNGEGKKSICPIIGVRDGKKVREKYIITSKPASNNKKML